MRPGAARSDASEVTAEKTTITILALMVLALVWLCNAWQRDYTELLELNQQLLVAPVHVPHDVHLVAWRNHGTSITVVVDGLFPHRIADACTVSGRF